MSITRRGWLASLGLFVSAACGPRKGTGYPGYALVATSGNTSLAAVDLTSFRLAKAIELGAAATSVVSAGAISYVLTPGSGSIHMVDDRLNRVGTKRLADGLSAIRLLPGDRQLVAVSAQSRELIVVDAHSLQPGKRYKLESTPMDLDVSANSEVAISTGAHGLVEVIHLLTGQRERLQMAGPIGSIRFRRDGLIVLVANLKERSLTALSLPELKVVTDLPLAMQPENLCFNSDFGQLFVTGRDMDAVAIVFPYNTIQVDQTVLAGRAPGVMACSETPAYLLVASRDGSDVCILDVDSRKMIGVVEIGQRPNRIVITPDSQYALVLNQASGDMAVIHIPAIRGNRLKSGAGLYTMIQVGEKPVDAAIVRRAS